jgi:hypothetical protein
MKGEAMASAPANLTTLKDRYRGRIVVGLTGNDAAGYAAAMEEMLDEWNPVGYRSSEVEYVIGPPSRMRDGDMIYHFDDGFGGQGWVLVIENERVVKVDPLRVR